jgi:hypothetical protein
LHINDHSIALDALFTAVKMAKNFRIEILRGIRNESERYLELNSRLFMTKMSSCFSLESNDELAHCVLE